MIFIFSKTTNREEDKEKYYEELDELENDSFRYCGYNSHFSI